MSHDHGQTTLESVFVSKHTGSQTIKTNQETI